MKEKKIKISLSTFLLLIAIVIIIVMGVFIYKLKKEQITNIQPQIDSLNEKVDISPENNKSHGENTTITEENKLTEEKMNYKTYFLNEINYEEEGYCNINEGISIDRENNFSMYIGEGFDILGKCKILNDEIICHADTYIGEHIEDKKIDMEFTFKIISDNTIELTKINNNSKYPNPFQIGTTYSTTTTFEYYEIKMVDENMVTIKVDSEKENNIQTDAAIVTTGVTSFPKIGTVAMVKDSGGEYCGISFYKLVNDEISKIGTVNFGADTLEKVEYVTEIKDDRTVVITATDMNNGKKYNKKVETDSNITNVEVRKFFDNSEAVLISEADKKEMKFYRLSKNYITGKVEGIVEAGNISVNGY